MSNEKMSPAAKRDRLLRFAKWMADKLVIALLLVAYGARQEHEAERLRDELARQRSADESRRDALGELVEAIVAFDRAVHEAAEAASHNVLREEYDVLDRAWMESCRNLERATESALPFLSIEQRQVLGDFLNSSYCLVASASPPDPRWMANMGPHEQSRWAYCDLEQIAGSRWNREAFVKRSEDFAALYTQSLNLVQASRGATSYLASPQEAMPDQPSRQ